MSAAIRERLRVAIKVVQAAGPQRVVINEAGEATTFLRAAEEYQISPDIIFIRDDGWSLGAPKQFQDVAEQMWADKWALVIPAIGCEPITYQEWKKREE